MAYGSDKAEVGESVPVTIGPLVADATGPATPAASIGSSF